ncbi:hypothetical protein H257_17658 [Aphanomyces astaci]|uniref:Tc1-like transposase DDE domain-containing protein n=1 Tax=Aphanomyces astaci TaxID=112090 RepID=W4FG06_APHAT|nr:hypothetical protein H257_17658 [Aphanomyces astaci]ETV65663.1 hypothetical protein H257_17658 [Aphanomyces astaci]|eukprot:XP_009844827.1 hypothetical protein H257_17658 [Aphanomyces astaci]
MKDFVKQRRQRSLTYDEKLDILWLQATLREDNTVDVAGTIARLLGRLRDLVQTFVRDRPVTRTRTVAKDVLALVQDAHVVTVADGAKDHAACLRAVQRFLDKQGNARGKPSRNTTYRITPAHEQARDSNANFMVPTVTTAPRRSVAYLDEGFIHHHYTRHADSLYDPMDTAKTKPKHKGTVALHLLGLDIFVGGKKNGRTVKDYHSMFNHEYFVNWFGKLLDEVEELGWSSAVFFMDNAKYHKGKTSTTPKGSWKKADLYQACLKYDIRDISPTDLEAAMWARLKKYIDEHIYPVVLHPIELIWANVKGTVGRAYTSDTTFQDVYKRLDNAFYHLDSETIKVTIDNSTAKLIALEKALRQAEEAAAMVSIGSGHSDGDSDTSSSCDESSAGSSDGVDSTTLTITHISLP